MRNFPKERLFLLNAEQQAIVLARLEQDNERAKIIKLLDNSNDAETHHKVLDALRNLDGDRCEHDRSWWKPCLACLEIDKVLWPESFDEDGEWIDEEDV